MNIGIFTDTYYPQINGVATSIRILENQLRALGHKVYVFTVSNPKAEKLPDVFRLPSMPLFFIPSQRFAFLYPPDILFKFRSLKLDIIHTHTEFPLGVFGKIVSGFHRIPIVHTYHTMYADYMHYIGNGHLISPKAAERYSRIFCNGANTVVAPTIKTKECLLRYKVKRPIKIIPTGFDFSRFGPERWHTSEVSKLKQSLNIPDGAPVIVTVSRLAKEKNIEAIINALPKLLMQFPNIKYIIVGGGPLADDLKKLAEDNNLAGSVIFTGPRPWDEIGKYYQLGDCFVCASTTETQGLTYIEAMASKIPVAAKKDDSINNFIKDNETGFLFEKDEGCADAITKALLDKENSYKIALKGYEAIEHLSAENFGKQIEAVYKECIETRPKKTIRVSWSEAFKKENTHMIYLRKDKSKKTAKGESKK